MVSLTTVIDLPTEQMSEKVAARFAECLFAPLTLTFSGQIGAGKTTFIRALLRAMGLQDTIKSPTFSLVESYWIDPLHVHHFDLYRIHDESELEYIGFRDYFTDSTICCIEWPEHAPGMLSAIDVSFTLDISDNGREMQVRALSPLGARVLVSFMGEQ